MPSKNNQPTIETPTTSPDIAAENIAASLPVVETAENPQAAVQSTVAPVPPKKNPGATLRKSVILRSYLVPLIVLAIFGAMLLFLILPKIGEVMAKLDQTNALYDQTRTMDAEIQTIFTLSQRQSQFSNDLLLINQIAPSGSTEVVNFHQKILALVQENSLIVQQSSIEESVKEAEDQASIANLGIIEIPSTFTLRGPFAGLKSFVEEIRNLSDFVIIGEMALRANIDPNAALGIGATTQDNWTLIITLIKYQFLEPNEQNQLQQVFLGVSPNLAPDQTVIDFAKAKFAAETSSN
jgi:hypothetical protein